MEGEDGLADLANGLVEVVDGSPDALSYVGGQIGVTRGSLELHAGGEEPLDDEVVQVARDAVAVLVDGQALPLEARLREDDVDRRLRGEGLGHRTHVRVEHLGRIAPEEVEDPEGALRRAQGKREHLPLPVGQDAFLHQRPQDPGA